MSFFVHSQHYNSSWFSYMNFPGEYTRYCDGSTEDVTPNRDYAHLIKYWDRMDCRPMRQERVTLKVVEKCIFFKEP